MPHNSKCYFLTTCYTPSGVATCESPQNLNCGHKLGQESNRHVLLRANLIILYIEGFIALQTQKRGLF